ncbi:MAG: hypothetical protein DMF69_15285 [Acidobacteria bacterium]|nr:MAG: hypothetical protein DMF69_15285 [Acidobacteriota bacterium]
MIKRLTVSLAAACLLLTIASQQPAFAKDTWTSVQSKNFLLIGNGSEKDIKQVATRLEQFRQVFTYLFPNMKFAAPVPTTVVVFKSQESYKPFKGGANLVGYFQPGPDVNYITLTTDLQGTQDPFDVIFHEYTHLLVNNTIGSAPVWFNEGLAEYYSTFFIKNDQEFALGKPIGNHVFLLRESKMLPLRTLFEVDHKSPHYNERNKQSIFYAQSWALMHYLIIGKAGRLEQLSKFLDLLSNSVPRDQAFQQAFQTTFEAMEKELREYVRRDRYNILEGHFKRKLETDSEMQSRVISEAEAQAYLGDLLLHSNRKDSMTYLQKAVSLDPDLPVANAAMGMAMLRERKLGEALRYLERAVKAGDQNYLVHYYYAYALSQQNANESHMVMGFAPEQGEKIRKELLKAIELRPDYPASYQLLSFVSLVTGNNLEEARTLLARAIKLSPGRTELVFMLGQLYLRNGDLKQARTLLEQVTNSNAEDEMRQHARSMLAQLTSMEEQRAQFDAQRAERTKQNSGQPTLSRPGNTVTSSSTANDPVQPNNASDASSSYLREALRKAAAGETQIQVLLLRIDCDAKGIVFVVKSGDVTLRLHTPKFELLAITSYNPSIQGDITCGPRKVGEPAVVSFIKKADKRLKTDGTITAIEFVPADFKFAP